MEGGCGLSKGGDGVGGDLLVVGGDCCKLGELVVERGDEALACGDVEAERGKLPKRPINLVQV